MAMMTIDRRSITLLAQGGRSGAYYDDRLTGFGARRNASGGVSYFIEYRPGGGGRTMPKRRMVIGRDGPAFRADAARDAAKKLLAQVALGHDPAAERTRSRKAESVADVLDIYVEQRVRPLRKAKTAAGYIDQIRLHLVPAFGGRRAPDLRREDVVRFHRKLGATRPTTANRCVALLGAAYAYATKNGHLPVETVNPARGVDRFRETGRDRYLTEDELGRLGRALVVAETTGLPWRIDPTKKAKHRPKSVSTTVLDTHAVAALRLLILTGARLREILHLRWEEVDFDRGLLFLSDSKVGRRALVIGAPALAILQDLKRIGPYVIAGRPKTDAAGNLIWAPRADLKKPWDAVRDYAGLHGVRLHDLRHSFASIGAGSGMGLPIIGALLGHRSPATTKRYAHLDADPLQRAATGIASRIEAAMTGITNAA